MWAEAHEGLLEAVYFISSLLAQIYTQGPMSPEGRLGEGSTPRESLQERLQKGRKVLNNLVFTWLCLALLHPFNTGTTLTCPHRISLSLQKPTPSHGPLTSSLQVTSSRTHSVLCCITITRSKPLRAETTLCSSWWLAHSSHSRNMDEREPNWRLQRSCLRTNLH